MDLADCRHAVFYENDTNDVAYIMNGSEQHIDTDEAGDISFKPMKQYQLERMREDRNKKKQDTTEGAEGVEEGGEEIMPADDGFDLNDAWDFSNVEDSPNFRFFD